MQRREFVKYGFSSLLITPLLLNRHANAFHYSDNYASPVVSIYDGLATSVEFTAGKKLNSDNVIVDKILSSGINNFRVARMVDDAVMKITNKNSVGKAWESLFPAGHPNLNTRIGIKINFSYGDWRNDEENDWSRIFCPFGPKGAVTNAIISGLTQMLDGNFPIGNITLLERMYTSGKKQFYPLVQGYRLVTTNSEGLYIDSRPGASRLHWIYSANPMELPADAPSFIAAPDYPEGYRAPQRIYKGIFEQDFLINYSIAKDHREAGVTGVMKNNYGCTDNPVGTHGDVWKRKDSPYPGTRLCVPSFYKNVDRHSPYILNILDALTGVHNGGPLSGNVFSANTIVVSKDPVALDTYLLNMINRVRGEKGMTNIGTENGWTSDNHPNASFLKVAAQIHEMGSMAQDDIRAIDLTSRPEEYELPALEKNLSLVSETRKDNNLFHVNLLLDKSKRNHVIESSIEDGRGKVIRAFSKQSTVSSMLTLEWDMKNSQDVTVPEGIYVWNVIADGIHHTSTVNAYVN